MSNIDNFTPIGLDGPLLITDKEWSALVDRHLKPDRGQDWYVTGYQDGQQAALQEVVKIVSATSRVVADDETRRIIAGLASVMSLLVNNIADERVAAGLVS
ncbi:hypothetical protein [Paracoccus sp. (in: a-proteobacteria)]|uniref:hypothetical protein n=1 Tax=Paracoccus sp. TaxID=267 RepID=UPI0028AB4504|nr:hypothetical protein [Paracoccus sp. (in: a-proteobacteria)]